MIGSDVVTDEMSDRPPHEMNVIARQEVAGALDLGHVGDLECDVVQPLFLVTREVDGVVVATAAQESEAIAHPIRHLEAEHVG